MGYLALDDQDFGREISSKLNYDKGLIIDEIKDVIKVHKNGRVERSSNNIQSVSPFLPHNLNVTSRDVYIDRSTNVWARTYVPKYENGIKFPLLVYFHGGGFCVGCTSWKYYHDFLGNLSSKSKCIIISVNYRLAPENRLPAAYEDGIKALMWVNQQEKGPSSEYWAKYCDFDRIFIGGDNAGGNIAYNVALKVDISSIKGLIMVQPFFGGEEMTNSEKIELQSSKSAVWVSDIYWRLALPSGVTRDHPCCNPTKEGEEMLENMRVMVCVGKEDVLRDRSMELCVKLVNEGNEVQNLIYVGDRSEVLLLKKSELISDIVGFISTKER